MKTKKIFVFSFNQFGRKFWKQLFVNQEVQVYHWIDPQQGLNNLSTVWPDLIIIEGEHLNNLALKCAHYALRLKSNSKVIFIHSELNDLGLKGQERLIVSPLTRNLLHQINSCLRVQAA